MAAVFYVFFYDSALTFLGQCMPSSPATYTILLAVHGQFWHLTEIVGITRHCSCHCHHRTASHWWTRPRPKTITRWGQWSKHKSSKLIVSSKTGPAILVQSPEMRYCVMTSVHKTDLTAARPTITVISLELRCRIWKNASICILSNRFITLVRRM
jgi:hypothetical protein